MGTAMPPAASHPAVRPSWKALLWGSLASAALWAPWPMLLSFFDGNHAMTGDEKVESAFRGLPLMMAAMFPTALLMNWWFAVRVMNARGRTFWLMPFLTLPVATVLMCAFNLIPGLSSDTLGRPSHDFL